MSFYTFMMRKYKGNQKLREYHREVMRALRAQAETINSVNLHYSQHAIFASFFPGIFERKNKMVLVGETARGTGPKK